MSTTERLLQFIDFKGDSKYKFYKKTGLSNGFLDKNRNIGSDKCEIISDVYPDLSLEWLITGNGSMLKSEVTNEPVQDVPPTNNSEVEALLREKVALLEENKALLQEKVAKLESEIQALKSAQSKSVNKYTQPTQSQPLIQPRR